MDLVLGAAERYLLSMASDPVETDPQTYRVAFENERIRVLERIVTDRGAETAAQIEALRDRDRISEEDQA